MTLTDADLADGVWEIVAEPKGVQSPDLWPRYLVMPCAKFKASAESDMLRSSQHALYAPCGCVDRTLLKVARFGGFPLQCARSAHLMVIRGTYPGADGLLVIRKRRGARLVGEMYSTGEERFLGRFALRSIRLTTRDSAEARGTLRTLAEPGAVDCGRATNDRSADRVYECAAAALAKHQPFFCRYSPPMSSAGQAPLSEKHAFWTIPTAYVGTSDGRVFLIDEVPGKAPRRGDLVLGHGAPGEWRTPQPGMTPPVLVRPDETRKVDPRADGILIMEALVGSDGSVRHAQHVKLLGPGASDVAMQMVLEAKFVPSRFFGIPVAAEHQFGMRAKNGRLKFGYSAKAP